MASATCEVWVCVDAQGDYGVGADEEQAKQQYTDCIGSLEDSNGYRLYKLALSVPIPATVELSGVIPEDGGEVALTVA